MKLLLAVLGLLLIYLSLIGLFFINNQHFTYNEVDIDGSNFLTTSEFIYYSETSIRYKCYENGTERFKYLDKNQQCDQIVLEIFSLKDGLTLKEIDIGAR